MGGAACEQVAKLGPAGHRTSVQTTGKEGRPVGGPAGPRAGGGRAESAERVACLCSHTGHLSLPPPTLMAALQALGHEGVSAYLAGCIQPNTDADIPY